jgi:hypothetical protein
LNFSLTATILEREKTYGIVISRERLINGPSHFANEGGDDSTKLDVGELLSTDETSSLSALSKPEEWGGGDNTYMQR